MSNSQPYAPGRDEKRVKDVLAHYEKQTEEKQAEEIEEALKVEGTAMIAVPVELADEVLAFIAKRRSA